MWDGKRNGVAPSKHQKYTITLYLQPVFIFLFVVAIQFSMSSCVIQLSKV